MKNQIKSIILSLLVVGSMAGCDDGSDKLTGTSPAGSIQDVSSSVDLAFTQSETGAGATLNFTGTGLEDLLHVLVDGTSRAPQLQVDGNEGSFLVPEDISLGEHSFEFIFVGKKIAVRNLTVVPIPAILYFTPKAAVSGQNVTILGVNLDYVSSVSLGTTAATISAQSAGELVFTMPEGASTDAINLLSTAGSTVSSSTDVVACSGDPDNLVCLTPINTNGSFEVAELGEANGVEGWGGLTGSLTTGEITDEERYDGFQCAKITINELGANPWNIQPTSNMELDPTATYHFSLWIKGSGITNIKIAMDEGGTPGWSEWGNPEVAVSTSEWTEISYEFSPASEANGGDNVGRLAISMNYEGNIGGVLYLDNFRVVRID